MLYGLMLTASCANRPEIVISPKKLPHATINAPYHQEITISKSQTPLAGGKLSDGKFPKGLELINPKDSGIEDTIIIKGVPSEIGHFPITVKVATYGTMCNGQTNNQKYELIVNVK